MTIFDKADLIRTQLGLKFKVPAVVLCTLALMNEGGALGAYVDPITGLLVVPNGISSAGSLLVTGSTFGLGYGTGAGGAVTQITNSATGVTLNKPTGQVTTVALSTAAGAEERFTVTNSAVAATDVVTVGTTYAGAGTPAVSVMKIAAGAFDIVITNLHASAALNALMVVNFAIVKGSAS